MQLITEIFQSNLVAFMSYDEFKGYQEKHLLPAIIIIVVAFFILGWLISKLFRPSTKVIKRELESISKELIEDLNTSKKFNAEYQDFASTEEQDDSKETTIATEEDLPSDLAKTP